MNAPQSPLPNAPQQMASGVPLLGFQTGRGVGPDGKPIVTLHLHTPAGVMAVFMTADWLKTKLIPQLQADAAGIMIANG